MNSLLWQLMWKLSSFYHLSHTWKMISLIIQVELVCGSIFNFQRTSKEKKKHFRFFHRMEFQKMPSFLARERSGDEKKIFNFYQIYDFRLYEKKKIWREFRKIFKFFFHPLQNLFPHENLPFDLFPLPQGSFWNLNSIKLFNEFFTKANYQSKKTHLIHLQCATK